MANFTPRGASRTRREARDTRKPSYKLYILDTSTSMIDEIPVADGENGVKNVKKIDELNRGLALSLKSLKDFEENNVLYKVFYQIIELNSYGKAVFSEFVPVSSNNERISFCAGGVTCLENSLNTALTYLDKKYIPDNKRMIDIFLFSDGCPTDVDGYLKPRAEYLKTLELFDHELVQRGLKPYITKHAIFIGNDKGGEEAMRSFADEGNFYYVNDTESLADKLVFATIKSQKRQSSRKLPTTGGGLGDILDKSIAIRQIDVTKCLGDSCGICVKSCPVAAITMNGGVVSITPSLCVGCGICSDDCPADAIYLMEKTESGN